MAMLRSQGKPGRQTIARSSHRKSSSSAPLFVCRTGYIVLFCCFAVALLLMYQGSMVRSVHSNSTRALLITNKPRLSTKIDSSFGGIIPRAFVEWPRDRQLPCFDPFFGANATQTWSSLPVLKNFTTQGLFYLKLCKTASSTSAGVHVRLAKNLAKRQRPSKEWPLCRARFLHGWAGPQLYRYGARDKENSFLWTTVREPTKRYISEFFHFAVAREGRPTTLRSFVHFLRKGNHADHHSLSWLSVYGYNFPGKYGPRTRQRKNPFAVKSNPTKIANEIMNEYDFIALTERMDESMVVLSMLLRVPLRDVLYLSSKQSGGYDDGAFDNKCFKIPPSKLTLPMQQHLESPEWKEYVAPELALWKAANKSLDLTIDRLGRAEVESQVVLFKQVLAAVEQTCGKTTKFPCTATGVRIPDNETHCVLGDMACGLDCIDKVADHFGLP